MKIVFWGKGPRSNPCLDILLKNKYKIELVVAEANNDFAAFAKNNGLPVVSPINPNDTSFINQLREVKADLFILAGYGKILSQDVLHLPQIMTINLHAGKLPKYRGSSPMNWALINGDDHFSISIFKVNKGIDTGEILAEKEFKILPQWNIKDLHQLVNQSFAPMLKTVVEQISHEQYKLTPQSSEEASYYPLRFPEDGLILWDQLTAREVHNRIRALTDPYPGAFSFIKNKKIFLLASKIPDNDFFGEPGRVYKTCDERFLVCAKDKCLWIDEARMEDGIKISEVINRYDQLLSVRNWILDSIKKL